MKRKPLYIFLITLAFVAPVLYWLRSRWGIGTGRLSFSKIAFAFASDRFLMFATLANVALYLFSLSKIVALPEYPAGAPVSGAPDPGPGDSKWRSLYGPDRIPVPEPPAAVRPAPEKPVSVEPAPASAPPPPPESKPAAKVIDLASKVMRDSLASRINDELREKGYEPVGGAVIDGVRLDFIGIADSDALVIGIIDSVAGDIVANETPTSPGAAPSWFSGEGKHESPVWGVRAAAAAISAMINEVLPEDNGISVLPFVVVPNATIANFPDMEAKWAEAGVSVVRFMNESALPDFRAELPDRKDTKVLPSYRKFVETLLKYFAQKAGHAPARKVG